MPLLSIDEVSEKIFAGGDKPKEMSKTKDEKYKYPIFANGYENEGLQGYSKDYKVDKKAITISARGTIGYALIREAYFTPIVRLVTVVPKENIDLIYLKFAINNIRFMESGTSQAQLTVPTLKKEKIVIAPISIQNQFAHIVNLIDLIDKQKFNYINKIKLLNEIINIFLGGKKYERRNTNSK